MEKKGRLRKQIHSSSKETQEAVCGMNMSKGEGVYGIPGDVLRYWGEAVMKIR